MYLKFLKILKFGQPKTDYTKRLTQSCVGKRVTAVLLEILSLFFFSKKKCLKENLQHFFTQLDLQSRQKNYTTLNTKNFNFFLPTMYYII